MQALRSFATIAVLILAIAIFTLPTGTTLAGDQPSADGWIPLFNGKDLTGWKIHPNPNPGSLKKIITTEKDGKVVGYVGETKNGKTVPLWTVKDGTLIGSGPSTHLFTVKDDFTDFKYRVEVKINDKGNSGQYFRTQFGPGFPKGYESQINATHGDPIKTGSLYPDGRTKLAQFKKQICVMNTAAHKPNEYFVQEVIADGNHIQIFVNGKKTLDFVDPNKTFMKGAFALQGHDPGTMVTFKKVEWQPLKK